MGMRGMLRDMPAGVPADSLLARIRGRRSFLVHDWERLLLARQPPVALAPAPWRQVLSGAGDWPLRALQHEYFWAFSRMEAQLRRVIAPFFWLAELRTLVISIRLLSGAAAELASTLKNSLLANNIRDLLQKGGERTTAVAGVAALLARYDSRFARLDDIYRSGGSGPLEEALYDISLQILAGMPLHPQIRCYVALLIDSRNLTTVAKRLRWRLGTLSPLLKGGTLSPVRLAKLFEQRDSAGLLPLAMHLGGQAFYSGAGDLERILYESQGRVMRRLAREADGVGAILDYLWRCGNEAANIALLERLESVGVESVGAELRR